MISSRSVARQIRSSRHRRRGTITNVAMSPTEVDEMNRPVEVTTVTPVEFLWAPAAGGETNDSRQVGTTNRVAYLPACTTVSTTSRFTVAGVVFEVVDVQNWDVGMIVTLTRTV